MLGNILKLCRDSCRDPITSEARKRTRGSDPPSDFIAWKKLVWRYAQTLRPLPKPPSAQVLLRKMPWPPIPHRSSFRTKLIKIFFLTGIQAVAGQLEYPINGCHHWHPQLSSENILSLWKVTHCLPKSTKYMKATVFSLSIQNMPKDTKVYQIYGILWYTSGFT
ncbi:hypothetical protein B0H13DRAFT_2014871, partial [Mycena leptocephala]